MQKISIMLITFCLSTFCAFSPLSYSDEKTLKAKLDWEQEDIIFSTDNFTLHGVLVKPDSVGPHPAVIFIHGDGPHDRTFSGYFIPIWKKFIDTGYVCMSWDSPGVGNSTGKFSETQRLHERAKIAIAAVEYLKRRTDIDDDRIGFWGFSQAGYVILGSLGLPIFAGATGGILYLLGPTGGYLIGFIAASYIVGGMISMKKELTFGWTILAMLTGLVVVYLAGASWLSFVTKSNFSQTFVLGVLPFIPGAVLKLLAGAIIFYKFLQPQRA